MSRARLRSDGWMRLFEDGPPIDLLGATGGTGKHFVAQALADDHRVTALVRSPKKLPLGGGENLDVRHGSIADMIDTDELVADVDFVVSMFGDQDPQGDAKINTAFVKRLVPSMRRRGRRGLLYQAAGLSRPYEGRFPPLF